MGSLYSDQGASVKTEHTIHRKGVTQGYILSRYMFTMYAEFIIRAAVKEESSWGARIGGRTVNNLRFADDTTLLAESKKDLQSLLSSHKDKSAKYRLYLNVSKTKVMATKPLSQSIHGEARIVVVDSFIFLGSVLQADGDT